MLEPLFYELGYCLYCFRTEGCQQVCQLLEGVDILGADGALSHSQDDCLRPVACFQLYACLMQEDLYRAGGCAEVVGNLFIGESSGDEDEHLSFPLGQRGILRFSHSCKVQALRGLVNANLVCVASFVK